MLKSNNFSYYLICKLSLVNIKIPSFSFLKKAILGLHKNLFWHISRKIGKILKKFQKAPLKALLNREKIFSKRLLKMHSFPKKKIYLKKMSVHPLGRILSYTDWHSTRGTLSTWPGATFSLYIHGLTLHKGRTTGTLPGLESGDPWTKQR